MPSGGESTDFLCRVLSRWSAVPKLQANIRLAMEENESGEVRTTEDNTDDTSTTGENKPLSKKQLKKQQKTQRWLERKQVKRQHERQKKKERLREARERGEDMGPNRKRLKNNTMALSSCKVRVVVDCSFDDLMSDKDVCKFVQQIQYCYSANRRAENPVQFYVTSLEKKTKARLESVGDYQGWDVNFKQEAYDQIFEKEDIVYLSSDSKNELDTLSEDKVYIIGGLVDHNHHKGVCHKAAEEKGMYHAQLPIGKYLDLKSRKVLTVNHVFDILVKFTETGDWGAAFQGGVPQRKVMTGSGVDAGLDDAAAAADGIHPDGEAEQEAVSATIEKNGLTTATNYQDATGKDCDNSNDIEQSSNECKSGIDHDIETSGVECKSQMDISRTVGNEVTSTESSES